MCERQNNGNLFLNPDLKWEDDVVGTDDDDDGNHPMEKHFIHFND